MNLIYTKERGGQKKPLSEEDVGVIAQSTKMMRISKALEGGTALVLQEHHLERAYSYYYRRRYAPKCCPCMALF